MNEIINEFISNPKLFIKIAAFVWICKKLVRQVQISKDLYSQLKNVQYSPIISLNQAQKLSKKGQPIQYLIKIQPQSLSNSIDLQKDVHSNEFWCVEPSLNMINKQMIDKINKIEENKQKNLQQYYNNRNKYYWNAKLNHQDSTLFKIKGFGKILSQNIFMIQSNFNPNKQKGIITYFRENFAYYAEQMFFLLSKNSQSKRKIKPTIKGPVIGQIKYLFKFLTNQSIIIRAKIENDEVTPSLTASSKKQMMDYFQNQIFRTNMYIALFVFAANMSFGFLFQDLRRIKKLIKAKAKQIFLAKQIRQKLYKVRIFESKSDELSDEKLCIVCYQKCRNIIIFSCRHLILCNQCYINLHDHRCPLCKELIQEEKVLHQKDQ